jgi:hypothetical protein
MSQPLRTVPMTEQDILRLRANGVLAQDESAFYIGEVAYAESAGTGIRRRLFVEGQLLESRRQILHD